MTVAGKQATTFPVVLGIASIIFDHLYAPGRNPRDWFEEEPRQKEVSGVQARI